MHLGIDIGTISVKIACLDDEGRVQSVKGPERHEGRPATALAALLGDLPLAEITSAAVTGGGRSWVAKAWITLTTSGVATPMSPRASIRAPHGSRSFGLLGRGVPA